MNFYKNGWKTTYSSVFFTAIMSFTVKSFPVPSDFPTAKQVFERGSDDMLITLTHLSYLAYDQQDNFKTYKLMYGLSREKRAELERYLKFKPQYYKNHKWDIKFLDVGKGLFVNNDSPRAVVASRCLSDSENSNRKKCEVNIAFRGTRSLDDWGNDLNFFKTRLRFIDGRINKARYEMSYKTGQAHQGFLKAYNTISQKISDILDEVHTRNLGAQFMVRVGGHSLGASLATLCAAHVGLMKGKLSLGKNSIHLETYGSPRTLGEKLSEEFTNLVGADNIVRFVNKDAKGDQDRISTIPFESMATAKFRHVGEECVLTPVGEEIYEGFPKLRILRTPHRIEGYKAAYLAQRVCNSQEAPSEKKKSSVKKLGSGLVNKANNAVKKVY